MATDETLIGAVARGDERALEQLCRRYERPLHRFLSRYTGGHDVEDLYQDTWLRAVSAAPRFDTSRRFSTWLFQIAVNLCRDRHRRTRPDATDPEHMAELAVAPDTRTQVEAGIDVRRLLDALPEAQRGVVILRYYHGLSEADVAEILDCPRGTVKSRLHNAMARLSALVGNENEARS